MKKFFFLTAIFALSTLMFFAQKTKFGLRGGINLATIHYNRDVTGDGANQKNLLNFATIGYADIAFNKHFSLQPGISLEGKGSKLVSTTNDDYFDVNLLYVGIPVNLVGKMPVNFGNVFIGAGPYFGYGVAGRSKTKVNGETETSKIEFGKTVREDFSPIDYGVNFLGGVEINNGVMFYAGYGLGLADITPKNIREGRDLKVTNRTITFGVGFQF